MSILEIYKNSKKFHEQQINKKWKMNFSITELSGKKIGFIGTGTLATKQLKGYKGLMLKFGELIQLVTIENILISVLQVIKWMKYLKIVM